jgi:hypothetical protein
MGVFLGEFFVVTGKKQKTRAPGGGAGWYLVE